MGIKELVYVKFRQEQNYSTFGQLSPTTYYINQIRDGLLKI